MNFSQLQDQLIHGESSEKRARDLRDQNPDNDSPTLQAEIQTLFEEAWQKYNEVETHARRELLQSDSIESCMLLAQSLMDIHIHPKSGFERDSKMLWEAQYLWLHLYYRTFRQAFFEQAQLCDSIRHAEVKLVD